MKEIDEEEEKALEEFMSKDAPTKRTLADIIKETLTEKQTELQSQMSGLFVIYFYNDNLAVYEYFANTSLLIK